MIRNLLHSAWLYHLAVRIITFSLPRNFKPLVQAVSVREITNNTRDIFLSAIDPVVDEIVEISLDCSAVSEFAATRKSASRVVRSLMDLQRKNRSGYLRLFGINFNSKWFVFLRPFAGLAVFSRKISFFIAYGDQKNPFFYSRSCGVILHICRFNSLGNAHIKQTDRLPTTVNFSVMKRGEISSAPAVIKKRIPQTSKVNFPIDLVYTWAGWERDPGTPPPETTHYSALSASRVSHIDELRFSLRSLSVNADFVNKIYLVVKDHPPSWLQLNHPKIVVVTDKELIPCKPDGNLNSHAVESALHHLEGLVEHFIYLNDDFFFLSPCFGSDFFYSNGIAKQFVENSFAIPLSGRDVELIPADHACWNSRELMRKEFGCYCRAKFKHAPYAIRKQDMIALEKLFPVAMKATGRSGTRSKTDIATTSSLIHFYSFYQGHSIPCRISNLLIHLDSPKLPIQTLKLLQRKSIKTFCLNENNLSHPKRDKLYQLSTHLLEHLFPLKCEYEV